MSQRKLALCERLLADAVKDALFCFSLLEVVSVRNGNCMLALVICFYCQAVGKECDPMDE